MKTKLLLAGLIAVACCHFARGARGQDVDSMPPVVVKTAPEAGVKDVKPGETEIRVTFSKAMADGSWSWSTAWEDSMPEVLGKPSYEKDHRTCVLRVKLEPGKTYGFWLNSGRFKNFKDREGRPAVPYLLVFQTAAKAEPAKPGKLDTSKSGPGETGACAGAEERRPDHRHEGFPLGRATAYGLCRVDGPARSQVLIFRGADGNHLRFWCESDPSGAMHVSSRIRRRRLSRDRKDDGAGGREGGRPMRSRLRQIPSPEPRIPSPSSPSTLPRPSSPSRRANSASRFSRTATFPRTSSTARQR